MQELFPLLEMNPFPVEIADYKVPTMLIRKTEMILTSAVPDLTFCKKETI